MRILCIKLEINQGYYTCVCKPHDIKLYSCIKNFKLFKMKVLKCLNVAVVPKNKKGNSKYCKICVFSQGHGF
jgi:hypothetical protein